MDARYERRDGPHREAVPVLRLVLQSTGESVEVTHSEAVIGRHSQADVRLPSLDVSRRHCRLVHDEGVWQVVDLRSLNGVFLNGEQVLRAPLAQGDLLRIGGFSFAVDLGQPVRTAPPHHLPSALSATLELLPRGA
jgi:pSer/pThr/pTyr-binding forkhead associated (FHA) protein